VSIIYENWTTWGASPDIIRDTKPANLEDGAVKNLIQELKNMGYNLEIIKRLRYNHQILRKMQYSK